MLALADPERYLLVHAEVVDVGVHLDVVDVVVGRVSVVALALAVARALGARRAVLRSPDPLALAHVALESSSIGRWA
eukprot:14066965-Heterocapsa_arctica.AAC.1